VAGINVVRDQIKEFAGTKKLFRFHSSFLYCSDSHSSGVKLIILDEADAMTADAQAALRRGLIAPHPRPTTLDSVIEKYTSNTRFCLICNYVNKITPALQSRCTRCLPFRLEFVTVLRFRFAPLQPEQIVSRLEEVVQCERSAALCLLSHLAE
jgi:replication factor C subunit 3/5